MSISAVTALAAGNALRVFLEPPVTAISWRLLRKATNDITGLNDAGAKLVYDGEESRPLDYAVPKNGVPYFYQAFYWDGDAWASSNVVSAQAVASYQDATTDSMALVRDRIDCGLQSEIAAARLMPQAGYIEVLTAPPVFEDTKWPVVSVHQQSESPASRGVGEMPEPDELASGGAVWSEIEGWLARGSLVIIAWTQNPDERIAMRQALRRIVIANLQVFDALGMVQVEVQQQDIDMVSGELPAHVYQSMLTLSYQSPVRVTVGSANAVVAVNSTLQQG